MSRNTVHFYLAELAEQGLMEIGFREIRILRQARRRALLKAEE
jgi:hypothetical protein